jgi:carbamoylphosphate synthase small subunit
MKQVYIEYASAGYHELFTRNGWSIADSPESADLICFTGGSDVSPHLYGEHTHQYTHADPYRDAKEQRLFNWAKERNKPMVGICRGGQFLNVMSGGRMYQHVEKHAGNSHFVTDLSSNQYFYCTSTHHQMMRPSEEAVVVGIASNKGERCFYRKDFNVFDTEISDLDYEIVFYPKTKCLCFQPHSEMSQDSPTYQGMRQYFWDCLNKYLGI